MLDFGEYDKTQTQHIFYILHIFIVNCSLASCLLLPFPHSYPSRLGKHFRHMFSSDSLSFCCVVVSRLWPIWPKESNLKILSGQGHTSRRCPGQIWASKMPFGPLSICILTRFWISDVCIHSAFLVFDGFCAGWNRNRKAEFFIRL